MEGKYYVMSYGVGKYGPYLGKTIGSLSLTPNDAYAISRVFSYEKDAEIFQRYYVYESSGLGFSSTSKLPSKEQFYKDLEIVKNKIGPKDYFIFFYAGHGIGKSFGSTMIFEDYEAPETNKESNTQSNEYLCLADTSGSKKSKDVLLSDNEIRLALKQLNTKKKIVILDCCFSGGFIGKSLDFNKPQLRININFISESFYSYKHYPNKSQDLNANEGFIMTASAEQGLSYETSTLNHGVFTYYFLKSLKYGDKNNDGLITLNESYKYIYNTLQEDILFKRFKNNLPTIIKEYDFRGDQSTLCNGGAVDIILTKKLNLPESIFTD